MVGTAVVVSLTRGTDAAAGFIYLLRPRWRCQHTHEQPDFAHGKSFILCILQPTKSACSAATENGLSGVGQPLSSVSGRKRYNTLDFASKIVCQQGCCSPLLETQSQRGFAPLDTSPVRAVAIHPAPAQWCPHTRTEKTRHENPPRIRVNFRAWFIVYDAVI